MKREPRSLLTRPLALLLAAALAAGPLPLPVLAAETQPTAAVQPATPETAAAAEETEPPAPQAAETETAEPPAAPAPETTATPENAQPALMTLAEAAPLSGETEPAVGGTITIGGIEYEVDRVATADRNGALTLTDGKAASGALVLADGIEYVGGLYDITELDDNAFDGNTALTSLDMSASSVKSIGKYCFRGCTALSDVRFAEDTVTNMLYTGVFSGCTNLTELSIPSVNLSEKYKNSAFSGSSIRTLTIYELSRNGIKANILNAMPDGFTLDLLADISSTALVNTTFGTTKDVTLNLLVQEDVDYYKTVFEGKNVTVQLYGSSGQEVLANVTDGTGASTGYATLAEAIAAINASSDNGPFTIDILDSGTVEWGDAAPNKATTVDFGGASVNLPATLTLQAPLTIQNITNINSDTDTLTTLVAGEHAFAMINGGSFGFAEIRGSDLTFEGTLPGGKFGGGAQVQLVGAGDTPTVTCKNVGRTDYYYNLPNMTGFAELVLDGAYLEADATEAYSNQLDGAKAVKLKDGGLTVNKPAEIEKLSGKGELRIAEGASLAVTGSASGSFTLPEVTGTELSSEVLSLPAGSEITLTNQAGESATITEPVVEDPAVTVTGGSLNAKGYATLADAFAAITADAGDRYALTLQKDVTLEGDKTYANKPVVTLPAKALVIDGDNHKLSLPKGYVDANADLTLKNVELDMAATYLRVNAQGATVTVESSVRGALDYLSANAKQCSAVIHAPAAGNVVDTVSGTSGKVMTLTLKNYGSQAEPAPTADYPAINIAGSGKGTLILENSWLVNGSVANWGNVVIRQAGGLAVTRSPQAASPRSWTVEGDAVADLYLTKMSGGFSYLNITSLGSASGKTRIHLVGDESPAAGDIFVKVPANKAENATFVIADDSVGKLGGLALVQDENGNYVLQTPAVTVTGGNLGSQGCATLADALAAMEADAGDSYTLTLLCDQTLAADTTLPDAALTINGGGYRLTQAEGDALTVQNDLTFQNIQLALAGSITYARAASGEKAITFAETASGSVGSITDNSGSRWLDIVFLSDGVTFGKVTGTVSSIGTRLTDLILTGFGTQDTPIDLTGKLENIAGLELNNSWVRASGDATCLGTIRTDCNKVEGQPRTGGLVLTGDTTVHALSVTSNEDFEVWMDADATLTVEESYKRTNQQVPLYTAETPADGHILVKAPRNGNKKMPDYALVSAPEGVTLYWDAEGLAYEVSYAPAIAMAEEAEMYKDAYTRPVLTLTDAQGIASISINGSERFTYEEGSPWLTVTPEADWLAQGENTVTATDVSGLTASFTFRYDAPADYGKVDEALGKIPADLSGYTAASVQALEAARDAVVEGVGSSDQALVDKMAQDILDAIAALEPVPSTDPDQPADPDRPADDQPADGDGDGNGANNSDNTSHTANSSQSSQAASASGSAAQPVQAAAAVIPQTADAAMPALWALLAAAALGGATVLTLLRRKHGQ